MRNPAKIYLVDTGLAKRVKSEDSGRLLENAIFLRLRRESDKIFYFDENQECDFVVFKNNRFYAYQVCYELNEKNEERELGGLIMCCKQLKLKEGFILTNDREEEFKQEGIRIKIIPAWKYLLSPNPY